MNAPTTTSAAPKTQLLRILGLDFGLAVVLGGTVGVGILRRAWVNLDLPWGVSLIGAGMVMAAL